MTRLAGSIRSVLPTKRDVGRSVIHAGPVCDPIPTVHNDAGGASHSPRDGLAGQRALVLTEHHAGLGLVVPKHDPDQGRSVEPLYVRSTDRPSIPVGWLAYGKVHLTVAFLLQFQDPMIVPVTHEPSALEGFRSY